jgi:hypothetical protein
MKIAKTIIVILLIVGLAAMINYGVKSPALAKADNPFGLMSTGVRPEGEKLTGIDMEKDQIALALELYYLACQKDKDAPCRAFYSICPTSNVSAGMDNRILLNILEIKNGEEFFRIDYRLKDSVPLFDRMPFLEVPLNQLIRLVTTERKYYNLSMEHALYQQVLNANTDENGIPYANWTTLYKESQLDPVIFNSAQEQPYRKSSHIIEEDTVTDASVTYNEEGGIYYVTISLDVETIDPELGVNKATKDTLVSIKEGAGSDNVRFTSVEVEFQMWDNGYFKEYSCIENWEGKVAMNLNVSSEFYYRDIYSYAEADCDISAYYANGAFVNN